MTDNTAFQPFAPGFDFLQGMVKTAGAALPGIGQWVAPTLNPEELDKRIQELRTVQFWLEQNARMLGATIQALEVQKMTLNTLQTMNVQMGDLRDALTIRMPAMAAAHSAAGAAVPPTEADAPAPVSKPAPAAADAAAPKANAADAPPAVDPMQWWGALTKQFGELATTALKDNAAHAAIVGATAVPGNAPAPARPPAAPRKAPRAAAATRKTAARAKR